MYLSDVNDNAPVFEQNDYIVDLPENMTAGTRVVQVHATDVDTGLGGKIRYTQILGPQNTSLNLDPTSGVITVATSNHGFDRELMPEYHLYVEARDDDGIGNRAQVLLVIRLIDVNDETPTFEKSLYEFILSQNLRNFTVPAFIKAIDNDAEAPNNEVRYELIYGNYENKFELHPITGELKLTSALVRRAKATRQRRQTSQQQQGQQESEVFVLTARAFDLGVPVRFSTTTIRVYPPESRTRTMTFIVSGHDPDRAKVQETLADVTGGKVIIQEIRPYSGTTAVPGATDIGGDSKDRSLVLATILYDGDSVVDIARIQQRLSVNGTVTNAISQDERSAVSVTSHLETEAHNLTPSSFLDPLQGGESGALLAANLPRHPAGPGHPNAAAMLHLSVVPSVRGHEVGLAPFSSRVPFKPLLKKIHIHTLQELCR